jgi:hypothetical protein
MILECLASAEVGTLGFLDEVGAHLRALDIDVYTTAIRQLDHEGRTTQEHLAFLRYQEEAATEMHTLVQSVQEALNGLDLTLSLLKSAALADTRHQAVHIRLQLRDPRLTEAQKRSLEFLLEDLLTATDMAAARNGYLEEVERVLVPLRLFCQTVFDSGDVIQLAGQFQRRVEELCTYVRSVREEWGG